MYATTCITLFSTGNAGLLTATSEAGGGGAGHFSVKKPCGYFEKC